MGLREYLGTFYIADSDMCKSAVVRKLNHCCFFVAQTPLLLFIVGGGKRSSGRQKESIVALTWQQCLRRCAQLLLCTYIACLVEV